MLYSPSAGEKENESDEEEEEGLTSEDIAELEKITKASQKFLTVSCVFMLCVFIFETLYQQNVVRWFLLWRPFTIKI